MLAFMKARARAIALATPHAAATAAGRAAFADGGTAVDAALAACATLTVVYPHMCSIGGDAIALVHAPDGTVTAVNGSGAAPAALDAARVRAALERDPVPVTRTGMPIRGPHTATVPGVLAAWATLRGLGGALDFTRILRPAIKYAADGCGVSRSLAETLAWEPDLFAADPGLRDIYFRDGRPAGKGDVYRQPALAASLDVVASHGVDVFYRGELGARYVAGLRAAGSVMTTDDLSAHATEVVAPLCGTAFGYEILTAPPNSQGFLLLELLAAMERLAVEAAGGRPARRSEGPPAPPDPLGPAADALAHLFRLASDDRDRHLCDPRFHDVPLDELLGDRHVRSLADQAGGGTSSRPGTGFVCASAADASSGDTIACVAADSDGWAVSIIQSIYNGFGAAILEPTTGIVAHDRGACFSLDPASSNLIEGGKRPLHTLMPVMVRREGRLTIVAGTMGGEAQPQIHAQILSRLMGGSDSAASGRGPMVADSAAAVTAPRWIYDEGKLLAETSVTEPCLTALRATGMPVELLEPVDGTVGHAQYIRITADGAMDVGTDPRADG
jgi:gamma-glutamyltranspeptidase